MATYFSNVIAGLTTITDEEGTDLPSLGAAKEEALKDARALMSHAVLQGRDISGRSINICNERGDLLASVPFARALKPFE
jgi:ATP-dependent protease HslVU (ClpYQ) peptidase subunit